MSDSSSTHPLVRGEIVFDDDDARPFRGATLYVFLEDTTLADADAVTIQRLVKSNVAFDPRAGSALRFEMHGEIPDGRALYTVRALVDLDGDGKLSHGDYTNTQSYPVLTRGHPREVSILVKRIE